MSEARRVSVTVPGYVADRLASGRAVSLKLKANGSGKFGGIDWASFCVGAALPLLVLAVYVGATLFV